MLYYRPSHMTQAGKKAQRQPLRTGLGDMQKTKDMAAFDAKSIPTQPDGSRVGILNPAVSAGEVLPARKIAGKLAR